jgi:ABC-2 type transport system ATP-binding protein
MDSRTTGRTVESSAVAMLDPRPAVRRARPGVVDTHGLAKRFGDVEAVRSVDLRVPQHSIFGFLGPNGAGKTTTLRMLVGLLEPSAGRGTVLGTEIGRSDLELRRRIGYLPQQPTFYPDLTARETLRYAARFWFRSGAGLERRIDDVVELVGLAGRADRPVGAFSGGERQRLGLAQAQVHEPELLILDEPAAGLDPIGRRDVLALLQRLREHATVLYSTHILDDVQRVSDMVGIVTQGTLVAQAPIDGLLAGTEGTAYRIVTAGPIEDVVDLVARQPWVQHVEVRAGDGNAAGERVEWIVSVVPDDDEVADRHLLRMVLGEAAVTVTEFGRQRFELEDAFLRIVEEQSP